MRPVAIISLYAAFFLLQGCSSPKSAPSEFVAENRALLDSCSNYMIEHLDTLLACSIFENATAVSIHSADDMIQCAFIQKNDLLQRFLQTEIHFIHLRSDSTIVYYYEETDFQNNRPMIIYSHSKSPEELDYDIDCQNTPKHIDGYYFETSDNIGLAI